MTTRWLATALSRRARERLRYRSYTTSWDRTDDVTDIVLERRLDLAHHLLVHSEQAGSIIAATTMTAASATCPASTARFGSVLVIDGSQTNRKAILSCDAESRLREHSRGTLKPVRIRGQKQSHRAAAILSGIEMVHMMRKRQASYVFTTAP